MEGPVCSLKHLAASPPHLPSSYDGHGVVHWSRRASYRLLQVALLYFTVTWIAWAFPPIYVRLSETGQAVVFTLVDTATAELQNRALPSSQQNTEDLLTGTKKRKFKCNESIENEEETSKNLSILKDGVDDKIFTVEPEQYTVRAEPKVIESKVDGSIEKKDEKTEEIVLAKESEPEHEVAAIKNASLKDTETGMNANHGKIVGNEGSDQPEGAEDIPSFSEWAQKQLAEAEKKKGQNATTPPSGSPSRASGNLKIRSKNYASPDCGAKIVGTNPEAMYAGSIISPSRDEYVLNACTNRFWFVVELCEAIQAKKIELANFELFSSSPRDFSVSLSDRFPSRDWRSVGHFTAQDERDIQSFNLNPHLFGKFIKVELHSHYGSEHYCPISLFRVYGTSEFEVLETEVEVHESVPNLADDDDDEEPLDVDTGESPKTLFGSAQDAVLSIVKKAAQVLVKSGDSQNETIVIINVDTSQAQESTSENCVSPSHIIVCDNCSDALFNQVFDLLSCRGAHLQALIDSPFVRTSFQTSKLCSEYGLDFGSHRTGAPYPLRAYTNAIDPTYSDRSNYLSALLPPKYIAALCNILAILEKKVVFNISYEINGTSSINLTSNSEGTSPNLESNFENLVITPPSTCTIDISSSLPCSSPSVSDSDVTAGFSSSITLDSSLTEKTIASQIKPTKTLVKEPDKKGGLPSAAPIKTSYEQGKDTVVLSETPLVEELPVSKSSVTASVVTREENQTKIPEISPEKEDDQAKITTPELNIVKKEAAEEKPVVPEADQQHSASVEKQMETVFDDKFQETQENLSLDSILSQMKDLEMPVDISSSAAVNPSASTTTVPPPNLAQTQQAQKESVFVRLSNRIKVLERNMSLSGQYLEELSRRYKKQVEEMQRAFNRTLAAVSEESRKGEEREQKRLEEMAELQKKLSSLTVAVETLLQERDSWQHKMAVIIQHVVLIVIEVMVIGVFLYFCRSLPNTGTESPIRKWSLGWRVKAPKRRRSIDGITTHESARIHNRRPSEEALHISGTYSDLLITDPQISEIDGGTGTVPKVEAKKRRRKRKDGLHKSSSSANLNSKSVGRRSLDNTPCPVVSGNSENENVPTRRASSSEIGRWWKFTNGIESEETTNSRQEHSVKINGTEPLNDPETLSVMINGSTHTSSTSGNVSERESPSRKSDLSQSYNSQKVEKKMNVDTLDENTPVRQGNGTVKSVGSNPKVRQLTSPFFIKTAMSSRSNRVGNNIEPSPQARLKSDNWEWYPPCCKFGQV
ncbi:hypothetical protein L9F63_000362 [Diploptera punctata]|uniref:SUN domain-containing protein n=1 Tax=Diploptera punctata TaxID=6984 RepID=A0AAD8ALS4_DIPPU|nr:hypothetical protein L9F63_000362 [Diploptera punctata]